MEKSPLLVFGLRLRFQLAEASAPSLPQRNANAPEAR
jgi:hypothetical protein